ncbi:MAG: hypothetical protein GY856_48885 [bacterium]|nr:hypothetical protein [bacterium]
MGLFDSTGPAVDTDFLVNTYITGSAAVGQGSPGSCDAGGVLERALDAERRELIRANEERLAAYRRAGREWAARWPEVAAEIAQLPLPHAHRIVTARAESVLPFTPDYGEAR